MISNTGNLISIDEKLDDYFQGFVKAKPLFLNKNALQSDYIPERIEHREKELELLAKIIAPSLRIERPSNVFVYGKTGTGKTLGVNIVTNKIKNISIQQNIPIEIININCKLKK